MADASKRFSGFRFRVSIRPEIFSFCFGRLTDLGCRNLSLRWVCSGIVSGLGFVMKHKDAWSLLGSQYAR